MCNHVYECFQCEIYLVPTEAAIESISNIHHKLFSIVVLLVMCFTSIWRFRCQNYWAGVYWYPFRDITQLPANSMSGNCVKTEKYLNSIDYDFRESCWNQTIVKCFWFVDDVHLELNHWINRLTFSLTCNDLDYTIDQL